jgi:hypothetical protein
MSLCVYAIVGRPVNRRLSLIRANGARVRSVHAGATSAVVAECEGPRLPTERALRGHDTVVRRIARVAPAVLPVRFGTLVDSDRSLVELLDAWSEDLGRALALVDRRYQMTLRLFALADAAPPGQRPPGNNVNNVSNVSNVTNVGNVVGAVELHEGDTRPGTTYLARRAREDAASQSAPELEPLREAFAPIVAAERIARHDQGALILTAYHLIPRGAAATYRRLLRRHAAALLGRVVLSGPWPPYAFAPELRR